MKFIGKNGSEIWVEEDDITHILVHRRPCAFSWGGNGEGAANTALSILSEFVPTDVAARHYLPFREHFVAHYPMEWQAEGVDVEDWLVQRLSAVGDDALFDADTCHLFPVLERAREARGVKA